MCRHTAHPVYNSDFHSSPRLKTVKGMLKQQGTAQVFQEGKSGLSHFRAVMMLILLGLRITWRHSTRCDYESVSPEGLTQQRRLPMWWNPSNVGVPDNLRQRRKWSWGPPCILSASWLGPMRPAACPSFPVMVDWTLKLWVERYHLSFKALGFGQSSGKNNWERAHVLHISGCLPVIEFSNDSDQRTPSKDMERLRLPVFVVIMCSPHTVFFLSKL